MRRHLRRADDVQLYQAATRELAPLRVRLTNKARRCRRSDRPTEPAR